MGASRKAQREAKRSPGKRIGGAVTPTAVVNASAAGPQSSGPVSFQPTGRVRSPGRAHSPGRGLSGSGRAAQPRQAPLQSRTPQSPLGWRGIQRSAAVAVSCAADEKEELPLAPLLDRGLLSTLSRPGGLGGVTEISHDAEAVPDDLSHVRALFSSQVPDVTVLGVHRVENESLARVYEAVRGTMGPAPELDLWHGTTPDCVRNILLGGFNRAYGGRHGTRLGLGTYFSPDAAYSLRFCGRSRGARHVMLLAKVRIGTCAKGAPELVEPPYRDADQMERYDATVDDVDAPSMYCIFRDYQALPCYVVEFASAGY